MNITITSENMDDYLSIRSAGDIESKDDLLKHADLIYQEISKYDKQKILIDNIETRFPPDMFSYYEQVQYFSKTFPPWIRLLKIAVVVSPEFEEVGKFWETLSVNRGFQYFAFTSLEEAGQWLIK
jgi:hypothetical protein